MTAPNNSQTQQIQMLRHCIATVAYRGAKAIRGARPEFAQFRASEGVRAPGEILAHVGDLYDWALSLARGKQAWRDSTPLPWPQETERFHATLKAFDDYLASDDALHCTAEELLQGPIADSLTHVGQLTILRRISGAPIRAENYATAAIAPGRLGADQPDPRREF
jgi:hypothetical protein